MKATLFQGALPPDKPRVSFPQRITAGNCFFWGIFEDEEERQRYIKAEARATFPFYCRFQGAISKKERDIEELRFTNGRLNFFKLFYKIEDGRLPKKPA